MKKRIKGLAALLVVLPALLTSCDNKSLFGKKDTSLDITETSPDITETSEDGSEDFVYTIYNSGVVSGQITDMSYEEWLLTIKGEDGITPTISIDEDGYWIINGENTNIKAKGKDGSYVTIGNDGNWYIDGVSTGVKAKATDGTKWYFASNLFWAKSYLNHCNLGDLFLDTNTMCLYKCTLDEENSLYWDFVVDLFEEPEVKTVTVSFETDIPEFMYEYKDKYDTIADKTIEKGDCLDLNTFAKDEGLNKYFLGWFAGEGVDETKITSYTAISRDCLLKAKWDYEKIENEYNTPGVEFWDYNTNSYNALFHLSKIASNVKQVHIAKTYMGKPIADVSSLNRLPENVESVSVAAGIGVYGGRTPSASTLDGEQHNYSLKEFIWRGTSDKKVNVNALAFLNCNALESIKLPSTVKSIGDCAFYNCTSLEKINLHDVEGIGDNAFYNCTSLQKANLPYVENIGKRAFYNCTSLTMATLSSVITIGEEAFYGCSSLTDGFSYSDLAFHIPNTTKTIQKDAFNGCTSLKKILINSSDILNLEDNSSCLFSYADTIIKKEVMELTNESYIVTSGLFDTQMHSWTYTVDSMSAVVIYRKTIEE